MLDLTFLTEKIILNRYSIILPLEEEHDYAALRKEERCPLSGRKALAPHSCIT